MTKHRAKPKRKSSNPRKKRCHLSEKKWNKKVGPALRMQQRRKFDKIKNQQRG